MPKSKCHFQTGYDSNNLREIVVKVPKKRLLKPFVSFKNEDQQVMGK
ncbi:hypothetical protein FHT21_000427 [Pedobacter sp. SG908]|nr:hypothetical protein [Pedobacter sp. SG908]